MKQNSWTQTADWWLSDGKGVGGQNSKWDQLYGDREKLNLSW